MTNMHYSGGARGKVKSAPLVAGGKVGCRLRPAHPSSHAGRARRHPGKILRDRWRFKEIVDIINAGSLPAALEPTPVRDTIIAGAVSK